MAEVEVFESAPQVFDASHFDAIVYQIGNNGFHDFVYETALRHPGIAVMHEANLHHLIADLTIRRGDWDGYLREAEYNGGAEALAFARRVRALEVGPDYDGLAMTRRLVESARGIIVHSSHMADSMRVAGFSGPLARIPHGAWMPTVDRQEYRHRLGLDETNVLVGIFGFLKPYKRIAESLRAFRRVVKQEPRARMVMVGEEHPEFPVRSMIRDLGLAPYVRVFGFAPMEDFAGYIGACDIVLNLRYPTVGESSGSLLRALGLGKAVLVSDVGSFAELPENLCLKVPVGAGEEDLLFEYMNLLVSRPEVARSLGVKAREYVATECNWDLVARRYLAFCDAVASGGEYAEVQAAGAEAIVTTPVPAAKEYLEGWAADEESRGYVRTHQTRLEKTLEITPRGCPGDRVLEMGAYLQITPALKSKLGYGEVRGCYYGPSGRTDHREVVSADGESFTCEVDLFDAEKDPFPYPGGHFSTVLCCELIEHLFHDPMHLMSEVNRILKPGGHLVLTTPNIASLRAVNAVLQGYHPGFFHAYLKPSVEGQTDARHNREYAPREIHQLMENSGFSVALLDTGPFLEEPHPEFGWVRELLERYQLPAELRGDGIYAVGRKTGAVRERYPGWLYS